MSGRDDEWASIDNSADNPEGLQRSVFERIRWLIERGYKDDEVVDHFDLNWHGGKPLELRERRAITAFIPKVRAETRTQHGPDPSDLVTLEAIQAAKTELDADGLSSGERSIAARLSVSRSTVRRRQGKKS